MSQNELFFTLALLRTEGVGDVFAKKLLSHFGSAEEVFLAKQKDFQKIERFPSNVIQRILDKSSFVATEKELNFIEKNTIRTYFFEDNDYPEKLKHCPDAPLLLFSKGDFDLTNRRILSIVGTREITAYGASFCKKLVEELSLYNPIIISGYALGVDICAHLAAIDNGLQTIGVLAHGFDRIYPPSHKKHVESMLQNGGFLTEFWSGSIPERENFIKRNRIVAGLSDATIIIESALKGGSLITANLANDYSREVFALPGRVTDKYSQGCNNLIKTQRANILTEAEDIAYMLNWTDMKKKSIPKQQQIFVELSNEEQIIVDFLKQNGKEQLDIISKSCEITVYKVASLLFDLELKGVVRPLPGKIFELL